MGVRGTLEKYIFSPTANDNGANMLIRLMSGAYVYFISIRRAVRLIEFIHSLHPFIQLGVRLDFVKSHQLAYIISHF